MLNKKIYIIHGYTASSCSNWFPWLAEKLKADNYDVHIPNMPNSCDPYFSKWFDFLSSSVHDLDENTIFVGHSLGCITSMRFLLNKNITIKGAVFVSGFIDENPMEDQTEGLQSFFDDELDIKKLKEIIPNRVVVTALDDDIVPVSATRSMSKKIDAKLIELNTGGHFIDRDGYTEFPILLSEITNMFTVN